MQGLFCAPSTLRETIKRNKQRLTKPHPSLLDQLDLDQHLYYLASLKLGFDENLEFIKKYEINSSYSPPPSYPNTNFFDR